MSEKDNEDLAYLIVGGLVVVGVLRWWSTTAKPWLAERVPEVTGGEGLEVASWSFSTADLVAAGVVTVVVLLVILTIRSSIRSRRAAKKKDAASS